MILDDGLFANLVGRYPDMGLMLFQVSEHVALQTEEWSPLVRFRFVRRNDGMVEMEVHEIFDPAQASE